jgi:hypothetical protein
LDQVKRGRHLSAECGELVAQDEDLGFLGYGIHPVHSQHPDQATDQPVENTRAPGGGASLKPGVDLLDASGSVGSHP